MTSVSHRTRGFNQRTALVTHKHLLGPAEKARMQHSMRVWAEKKPQMPAWLWARVLHRLPATVIKVAAEVGITILP